MTEISGIREETRIDFFDRKDDLPQEKVEAVVTQEHTAPGVSENRMKAEEALQRATSPNLRILEREQEIKAKIKITSSPTQRFTLLKEIFQMKVQAFTQDGGSIENFADETRSYKGKTGADLEPLFSGTQRGLKKDLFTIYAFMYLTSESMPRFSTQYPYKSLFLELYQLEEDTGFRLAGTGLLISEAKSLLKGMIKLFENNSSESDLKKFYWDLMYPDTLKIFQHLEKGGNIDLLKIAVSLNGMAFFKPDIYHLFSTTSEGKDPLVDFLPYIVKYGSLEAIKPYCDDRFKDLSEVEQAYQWIDLCCKAAEILAPINQKKSAEYLDQARKEKEAKLWAYPFYPYRAEIEAKAKLATARIEAATLKAS